MDFKIGDRVVYPTLGVAEIVGIENKEISNFILSFYVLRVIADPQRQIMVPKDKAEQVGLRSLANNEEIEEVFDILREEEVYVDKQTWNRRSRGFNEKIKTGSLFEIAEVFRDLYRLKDTKALSFGERQMMERARSLIVKEVSVAKKWTENKVENKLEEVFSA